MTARARSSPRSRPPWARRLGAITRMVNCANEDEHARSREGPASADCGARLAKTLFPACDHFPDCEVTGNKMRRVTGIGGIFFKAQDPEKLKAWYQDHLGLESDSEVGGVAFKWREVDQPETIGR